MRSIHRQDKQLLNQDYHFNKVNYLNFQSEKPCDGGCNDMEEDIANEEENHNEIFEHIEEEDTSNTCDIDYFVHDNDAEESDSLMPERCVATVIVR